MFSSDFRAKGEQRTGEGESRSAILYAKHRALNYIYDKWHTFANIIIKLNINIVIIHHHNIMSMP